MPPLLKVEISSLLSCNGRSGQQIILRSFWKKLSASFFSSTISFDPLALSEGFCGFFFQSFRMNN